MQRSIVMRLFPILLISVLLITGAVYAAPDQQTAGKTRLTLDEAKALINERVFGNQLQEIFLHELTTDEVWNRMGVQVFAEGFLIDGDRILLLCQDPTSPSASSSLSATSIGTACPS